MDLIHWIYSRRQFANNITFDKIKISPSLLSTTIATNATLIITTSNSIYRIRTQNKHIFVFKPDIEFSAKWRRIEKNRRIQTRNRQKPTKYICF